MRALLLFTIALLATSCREESSSCHFRIVFNNNYDKNTYTFLGIGYPDTILAIRLTYGIFENNEYTQSGQNNGDALRHPRNNCLEYIFQREITDTLMFYIIDVSIVENNSWQTIIDNYLVLQRYDLSLEDIQQLGWSLSFPPTEAMKDMKMYPPYGTYNKIESQ
jgi:hypothetical protein